MPVPAPIVELVVASEGEVPSLERLWRDLDSSGACGSVQRCFAVPPSLADEVRAELGRIAGRDSGARSWTVHGCDARQDPVGVLAHVCGSHPGADVAWIDARALLPACWDLRLQKAAYAEDSIGIAVPLCDASPLHALLDPGTGPAEPPPSAALLDRAAYCLGDRTYYEVPVGHGACSFYRHDALAAARPVAGEGFDSLRRRMRVLGFVCVVCDFVYVGFTGGSLDPVEPDPVERSALQRNHPLGGLRLAVRDAIAKGLSGMSAPGLDARPVQLHVMHYWGGGLDKWVRDFIRADASRTNLILSSFRIGEEGGQRLVLYADPDSLVPIRTWDIALPIRSTASSSVEYRRILKQVVKEFDVEAIIASSLIWHSLDALELDVPTTLVFHDFYPICQAINAFFDKPCQSCTPEDLRRCSASNPLNATFKDLTSAEWDALRSRFVDIVLARGIEIVVPSASVARTLRSLEPRLRDAPVRVIAHGIELKAERMTARARAPSDRLRLVLLGRHTDLKGAKLLGQAAQDLRSHAEITLLGCGAAGVEAARQFGWKAIERYESAELPGLMCEIAPDAGLLASIVPETFSYTLSELLALGVPPLATAMGSFKDRITDGEDGFLFEPDAVSLVAAVKRLQAEPALLESVSARLASAPPARSTAEMLRDYEPLLPKGTRDVARFKVGIGWQSGLTEPYRQLSEAYSQLSETYASSRSAYEKTRSAYEKTREAYDHVRAQFDLITGHKDAAAKPVPRKEGIVATKEFQELFPWAESLWPKLLKSPWWIGHIPFAFELICRQKPRTLVELGTYSGSSFAAFCQAAQACGAGTKCYGVDLWEGDIHMGSFDEALYREVSDYMATNHPDTAILVRKDFNAAAGDFADGSIDFLHIDGTHTYEAVANDFHTWLPKVSDRGVVLFHDTNVTVENVGEPAKRFGVRRFFDETKGAYAHIEFDHCYGLGVLVVGSRAAPEVMELVRLSQAPGFKDYFEARGAQVSRRFEEMGERLPVHGVYGAAAPLWRRAANKARRILRRALDTARSA